MKVSYSMDQTEVSVNKIDQFVMPKPLFLHIKLLLCDERNIIKKINS